MLPVFLLSLPLIWAGVHARVVQRDVLTAEDYSEGLEEGETPATEGNYTADSLRLLYFDGCDKIPGAISQIISGWEEAQKIMALQALRTGAVDFNTAGAVDYLGAPGLNQPRQDDFNAIFKQFSTMTTGSWPFAQKLHIRCDDPSKRCPCGVAGLFAAYTTNKDAQSGLARINFCPSYFTLDDLSYVIRRNQGVTFPQKKYNMFEYWTTKAHIWTHELLHIDWVTNSNGQNGGHNKRVRDLRISFRTREDGKDTFRNVYAYGPLYSKILARLPEQTGDYTIQNADNMAMFMISQYVQSVYGQYPNYPLATDQFPSSPPTVPPGAQTVWDNLFITEDDGSITLNGTNPLAAPFAPDGVTVCGSSAEDDEIPDPVTFTSFALASAYPTDYVSSVNAWMASETDAPSYPAETDAPVTEAVAVQTLTLVPVAAPPTSTQGAAAAAQAPSSTSIPVQVISAIL